MNTKKLHFSLALVVAFFMSSYATAQSDSTAISSDSLILDEAVTTMTEPIDLQENNSIDSAIMNEIVPDTTSAEIAEEPVAIDTTSIPAEETAESEIISESVEPQNATEEIITTNEEQSVTTKEEITTEEVIVAEDNGKKKKAKKEKRQYGVKSNHWSIAGHVGVAFLDGDQHQDFNDMWPRSNVDCSFDFMVEYSVNPGFGVFVEYAYNPYNGYSNYLYKGKKNSAGLQPNLSLPIDFKGLSHEVSVGFSLNMLNMFYPTRSQTWGWYLNAGAGFSFYEVDAYDQGTTDIVDREINGVHVAPSIENGRAVTFPIGTMVEYNPLKWLAIALNIEYRLHAKDNFDAVEKGNANDNTIYMSLGLRWKINHPKDKERPHVRNMSMSDYLLGMGSGAGNNCCDQVATNTQKIAELEELLSQLKSDTAIVTPIEKEADDDNDGVPNSRDREPNTPEGSFVNTWGQALDQKGVERILGYGQYQPDAPAIYFSTGTAKMSLESQRELAKIARKLYADPTLKVDIIGYCDNIGSDELNNPLSIKRAEEAKEQLVNRYGVDANRINTYGKGKQPGPADDFEPNRRCDFVMYNEKVQEAAAE